MGRGRGMHACIPTAALSALTASVMVTSVEAASMGTSIGVSVGISIGTSPLVGTIAAASAGAGASVDTTGASPSPAAATGAWPSGLGVGAADGVPPGSTGTGIGVVEMRRFSSAMASGVRYGRKREGVGRIESSDGRDDGIVNFFNHGPYQKWAGVAWTNQLVTSWRDR